VNVIEIKLHEVVLLAVLCFLMGLALTLCGQSAGAAGAWGLAP
jgi:hypothetical protein